MVTGLPDWASWANTLHCGPATSLVGTPILDSSACSLPMPAMPRSGVQLTVLARSTASRRVGLRPYMDAKRTAAAGPHAAYASWAVRVGSPNWLIWRTELVGALPPLGPPPGRPLAETVAPFSPSPMLITLLDHCGSVA